MTQQYDPTPRAPSIYSGATTYESDQEQGAYESIEWLMRLGSPRIDGAVSKIAAGSTWESGINNPKVVLNGDGIAGRDASGNTVFRIRSSDGKGEFFDANALLDRTGFHLAHTALTDAILWDAAAKVAKISGFGASGSSQISMEAPGNTNTAKLSLVGSSIAALVEALLTVSDNSGVLAFLNSVYLQGTTGYHVQVTNAKVEAQVNSVIRLLLDATNSELRLDTDDFLRVSSTGLLYHRAAVDRFKVTATEAQLYFDANDYIIVNSSGFQHVFGGVARINISSALSDLIFDANDYLSIAAGDFSVVRDGNEIFAGDSLGTYMRWTTAYYVKIVNTSGFEYTHNSDLILSVSTPSTDGDTAIQTFRRAAGASSLQRIRWKDFSALVAGDKVLVVS